jgi:subtilisin
LGIWSEQRPLAVPLNVGLREMSSAIRQLNQIQLGSNEETAFEPLRGPANVTRLPLNPSPRAPQAMSGTETSVHELKAAMALAGLARN